MWQYEPTLPECRYEDEEAEGVCEAMERMAQLFLSDSGKVEDVTDQDHAASELA